MRKLLLGLAMLSMLALLSFGAVAAQGRIMLYGGNQDIHDIDPATGENYSINAALRSLYDALFIARSNDIVPHLVTSFQGNEDATVWDMELVQNAIFHDDGSPVNADAVGLFVQPHAGNRWARQPIAGRESSRVSKRRVNTASALR